MPLDSWHLLLQDSCDVVTWLSITIVNSYPSLDILHSRRLLVPPPPQGALCCYLDVNPIPGTVSILGYSCLASGVVSIHPLRVWCLGCRPSHGNSFLPVSCAFLLRNHRLGVISPDLVRYPFLLRMFPSSSCVFPSYIHASPFWRPVSVVVPLMECGYWLPVCRSESNPSKLCIYFIIARV